MDSYLRRGRNSVAHTLLADRGISTAAHESRLAAGARPWLLRSNIDPVRGLASSTHNSGALVELAEFMGAL
jgi:hypothetical protein